MTISIADRVLRFQHRGRRADRRPSASRADGGGKQLFTRQLAAILEYARQVQAIDTSGVPVTAHVRLDERFECEDELLPCLSRDEALANAPDAAPEVGLFRVPRVIG
jgi:aspartyl-tRNA(Asn)/glutamyl-tRNA(Gln) amidotransferase subunit C